MSDRLKATAGLFTAVVFLLVFLGGCDSKPTTDAVAETKPSSGVELKATFLQYDILGDSTSKAQVALLETSPDVAAQPKDAVMVPNPDGIPLERGDTVLVRWVPTGVSGSYEDVRIVRNISADERTAAIAVVVKAITEGAEVSLELGASDGHKFMISGSEADSYWSKYSATYIDEVAQRRKRFGQDTASAVIEQEEFPLVEETGEPTRRRIPGAYPSEVGSKWAVVLAGPDFKPDFKNRKLLAVGVDGMLVEKSFLEQHPGQAKALVAAAKQTMEVLQGDDDFADLLEGLKDDRPYLSAVSVSDGGSPPKKPKAATSATVPNLAGKSLKAAEAELKALGLKSSAEWLTPFDEYDGGTVSDALDDGNGGWIADHGEVFATSPEAGRPILLGDEVVLRVLKYDD